MEIGLIHVMEELKVEGNYIHKQLCYRVHTLGYFGETQFSVTPLESYYGFYLDRQTDGEGSVNLKRPTTTWRINDIIKVLQIWSMKIIYIKPLLYVEGTKVEF